MRIISPAPITNTRARATSATTRVARARPRLVAPAAPFFNASTRSGRLAWSAGARPARSPEPIDMARAKPSTDPLSRTSSRRGMVRGASATRPSSPHAASSTPSAPPTSARSSASVKSWRTMRRRPLPSAARMASSRWRVAPRASSMLATFAQAIRSTSTTAPSSAWSTGLIGPTRSSSNGTARCDQPVCSGILDAIRGPTTRRSAWALCSVMPGLRRANALRKCRPRFCMSFSSHSNGINASALRSNGKRKLAGSTPTMV